MQSSLRKNPNVAALHIALGDFAKGMELLKRQISVSDFEPLRNLFIDIYTLNKSKIQTLPHTSPLNYTFRGSGNIPFIAVSLNSLIQRYNQGIELTTKGDFVSALDQFRLCLQNSTLFVVKHSKD